ncbi:hypothetical protein [Streptomyces sp. AP-93]|uniref:hypothetical protein n=1 Tax=Streptomyces sp. AP-93 TaxID=2929048 RepID=UPI001FAF1C3C|nr:hypothetical protein [Streptomyces sp. AP-93]MCJ0868338.1 hypothetical protein [Streptomyces sp. AP-93]
MAREQDGDPLTAPESRTRFDGRSRRRVQATTPPDFLRRGFNRKAVQHAVKSLYAHEDGLRSLPVA